MSEVAARVDAHLTALLSAEVDRWTAVDPDLEAPFQALRSAVLAGGKRLRPACCYWAFVGAGGDPDAEEVIAAAAALELMHAGACIHDDVIDDSERRHGQETVHTAFARRHRLRTWRGAPETFGAGVAILLGDLAMVYSERLLGGAPPEATRLFEEVRVEVNVGQYLDVLGGVSGVRHPAAAQRARQICRYKTAKYTVERPLQLGAALAAPGRLDELAGPLSDVGLPLGEAFQLTDDLLGVFGDPEVTGKPVGDDLRDGKPTLLAALARAGADPEQARFFDARFGAADLSLQDAGRLAALIDATGAREEVERTIAALVAEAHAALDRLDVLAGWTAGATAALRDIAEFVTDRAH
jgi:geranylgeranyl diphosphate synthase type I